MSEKKHRRDWKRSVSDFIGKDLLGSFPEIFDRERPPVNIYETDQELMVLVSLPGVENIQDIKVYSHHQSLVIKGQLQLEVESFRPVREEISRDLFERTINLPHPVKTEPTHAAYKKGILKLLLTKIDRREYSQIIMEDD